MSLAEIIVIVFGALIGYWVIAQFVLGRPKTPPASPQHTSSDANVPQERRAERVVACAYCAIYQPIRESILDKDGLYYCCSEHQQKAATAHE